MSPYRAHPGSFITSAAAGTCPDFPEIASSVRDSTPVATTFTGARFARYIATGTPRLCTAHRGHNTIIHAPSGAHDQSFKTYRHNSMLSIRLTIIQTSVVMKISSLTIRWATSNPPVHYRCYDHLRPAVGVATLPRTTGYCAPVAAGILPAMRCSVRAASTAKDSASLAWLIMPYSEMFRTW